MQGPVGQLEELPGDVSLRRYMRLTSPTGTAIVAIYPPQIRDSCRDFLITTRLLSEVGVRVPEILASDCSRGLTLLEDVGPRTLYERRHSSSAHLADCFHSAAADITRLQSLDRDSVAELNPPLDRELLWRELQQTWTSLLEPYGVVADRGFARALEQTLREICDRLDSQVPVPCHRDFMSRNLVPVEPHPVLAVLDHQDLRLGPPQYDLASLLNDSLFPAAQLEEEILNSVLGDDPELRRGYHRAAVQRTLKATGTYETFALRGFPRHRRLIPPTLDRAVHHLAQLPEASGLAPELDDRLAPVIC
jgi:aminoglycoside/choline kinase family phosphotransferase